MKRNAILFLFILIISTEVLWAKNEPTNEIFVKNMMAIIPQAKDKEFADYQTCINTFFESVNNNDLNASLKCYPINQKFQALNVKTYTDSYGLYEFSPGSPLPSNSSYNYISVLDKYFKNWQKYYMLLFLASNPGCMEMHIRAEDADYNNQLLKLQQIKNSKKYSAPKILKVCDFQELNAMDKAMNVVEKKLIILQVSIDSEKIEVEMHMGKINNNWQIIYISHPGYPGEYS